LSVAEANALVRDRPVRVVDQAPAEDRAALFGLARWALRYAPRVAIGAQHSLLIDLAGTHRLYPDQRQLLQRIRSQLHRMGITAHLALAPTFTSAAALARAARRTPLIVDSNRLVDELARLPIASLGVEPAVIQSLSDVGITHIGPLLDLPRSALIERYGRALVRRLDQALGRAPESLEPIHPTEPMFERIDLPGPARQIQAIHQVAEQLIESLCERLVRRQQGGRCFELAMHRIDNHIERRSIRVTRPAYRAKHLWRLMRLQLEQLPLGEGVERVDLRAGELAAVHEIQASWWPEQPVDSMPAALGELIDVMVNRLGADRVVQVNPRSTWVPERNFERRPADAPRSRDQWQAALPDEDRPSRLLSRPKPIQVIRLCPDGGPAWLQVDGQSRRVVDRHGPRRIEKPWWNEPPPRSDDTTVGWARDYWRVQDSFGRWLWLFHERNSEQWFLHGLWA
jgi:protein ImuB